MLALAVGARARAQVPAEFQDLYPALEQKLDAFEATLEGQGHAAYPVTFTSELLTANGNRGRALLGAQTLPGVRLELDRLRALGVQAVTVAIPFPILDPAFLQWNGDPQDYAGLVAFFAAVANEAHARGMKLAVESAAMFGGVYSAGSGMNAAAYYPALSDDEFVAGRAAQIVTIVGQVRPDIINVGSEPDTEYALTGKTFLDSPQGFAGMVGTFIDQLAAAGLAGSVPVVAGSGTWLYDASAFVAELVKIPGLYGIDLHLYPINHDYLDRAVALAAQAHDAGKKVTMLEAWLEKVRDGELGVVDPAPDPSVFARDAYGFWAPLDQKFLAVLVTLARTAKFEYVSPFWDRYYFAYLDYDQVQAADPPLGGGAILSLASSASAAAMAAGEYTDTGRAWAELITPPRVRRHLRRQ